MNHPLGSFIKRFFSHYLPVQKGLSVNTILAYRDAVKLLLCHAADTVGIAVDELAVEDISEKIVLGFLDELEQTTRPRSDSWVKAAKNAPVPYGRKRLLCSKVTCINGLPKDQAHNECSLTPTALPSLASASATSPASTALRHR